MAVPLTDAIEVHPEDVELVEKLAKLQQMHEQITDLRELLPSALFGPAREAVAQPRRASPRTLAMAVSKAAQRGNQEVQAFKKDWHDDKVRQMFKEANAAKTTQGTDVWLFDYQAMNATRKSGTVVVSTKEETFDTAESAKTALEGFQKSNKQITIEPASETNPFPLVVQVARFKLRVIRDESDATFRVEPAANDNTTSLLQDVVVQINKGVPYKKLGQLLALINAYHDVRIRKCDKCNNLVDGDFRLPIVRNQPKETMNSAQSSSWRAYHSGCKE